MQTFLPYSDFWQSAITLDLQRRMKQRVETYQILCALHGKSKAWHNHPATLMWVGYENALVEYGLAICKACYLVGMQENMSERIAAFSTGTVVYPHWLNGPIHATHRAALLFKNYDYYKQFAWTEQPFISYHWPSILDVL